MHLLSYRGCWHRISRCFLLRYRQKFRPSEQEFTPGKGFILHAVSLRQAFAHCGRFLTAASRRSMDRVAVPFWLVVLSDQLPVIALVGHYPTNKLMGRRPLPDRKIFTRLHSTLLRSLRATPRQALLFAERGLPRRNRSAKRKVKPGPSGISPPFGGLSLSPGEVPTCYAAVRRSQRYCYR